VARIGEDAEAFESFYREHVDAVLRYATRRTDDPHDAADLVAEVFLAAIRSAAGYREDLGSPIAWLYGIARNLAAAERRRAARAFAAADVRGEPSPWRAPRAIKLGELSFAFYMIHLLVMRTGEYVFRPHPREGWLFGSVATVASFTISFTAAWILHNYIEKPARKLLLSTPAKGSIRGRPVAVRTQEDGQVVTADPGHRGPRGGIGRRSHHRACNKTIA
jgi:hypothetical protein